MSDHAKFGAPPDEPAAQPTEEGRVRLTARLVEVGIDSAVAEAALRSIDMRAFDLIEHLLTKVPRTQLATTEVAAELAARRKVLVQRAGRLGIDREILDRTLIAADLNVLTLLERLAANAEADPTVPLANGAATADTALSVEEYRAAAERLGAEYVGSVTRRTLSFADATPEQLVEDAEVLAETARTMRSVPVARRDVLWPAIVGELNAAAPSYERIVSVLVNTGIVDALEAEDRLAFRNLRPELLPSVDRELLRAAGEPDLDAAVAALVRAAHRVGETAGRQDTIAQLLEEGVRAFPSPTKPPPPPKRKWWTAWGKLLMGAGLAGLDVAGVVGMGAVVGPLAPLAVGVTWSSGLASCAAGGGAVVEAVGAFRGE